MDDLQKAMEFVCSEANRIEQEKFLRIKSSHYDAILRFNQSTSTNSVIVNINPIHPFVIENIDENVKMLQKYINMDNCSDYEKILITILTAQKGDITHEACHLESTDFEVIRRMFVDYSLKSNFVLRVIKDVDNIIEDSAVELIHINTVPEDKYLLEFGNELAFIHRPSMEELLTKGSKLEVLIEFALQYAVIGSVKGTIEDEELFQVSEKMKPILDEGRLGYSSYVRYHSASELLNLLRPYIEEEDKKEEKDYNYQHPSPFNTGTSNPIDASQISITKDFSNRDNGSKNKEKDKQNDKNGNNSGKPNNSSQSNSNNNDKNNRIDSSELLNLLLGNDSEQNDDNTGKNKPEPKGKTDSNSDSDKNDKSDSDNNSDNSSNSDNKNGNNNSESDNSESGSSGDYDDSLTQGILKDIKDIQQKSDKNSGELKKIKAIQNEIISIDTTSSKGFVAKHFFLNSKEGSVEKYKEYYNEVKRIINSLISKFNDIIDGEDFQDNLKIGTHLNLNKMYDKKKMWMEKNSSKDIEELGILVMIDSSGSMKCKMEQVHKTLIIIYEFCKALEIPLAIIGENAVPGRDEVVYTHILDFYNCHNNKSKYNITRLNAHGNTREDISFEYCSKYLLSQDFNKKLLIAIGDGIPVHDGARTSFGGMSGVAETHKVCNKYKHKIDVVSIALEERENIDTCYQLLSLIYPKCICVDKMSTLPKKLINIIQKNLFKS